MSVPRIETKYRSVELMADRRQFRAAGAPGQGGTRMGGNRFEAFAIAAFEGIRLEKGVSFRPDKGDPIRPVHDLTNDASHLGHLQPAVTSAPEA